MDKSMLGDLDSLPEEDKMRMAAMVDQLQIRDRFGPYERIPDILPFPSRLIAAGLYFKYSLAAPGRDRVGAERLLLRRAGFGSIKWGLGKAFEN